MASSSAGVLLVCDHTLMRESLARQFEAATDAPITVSGCSIAHAVEVATDQRPRVLAINLGVDGSRSLRVMREVRRACPATALVCLAEATQAELFAVAVNSGARGFLIKPLDASDIEAAIGRLLEGGVAFDESFYPRIRVTETGVELTQQEVAGLLTDRQTEVLRMIANGDTKRQIADAMGISEKTVEGHTDKIMAKLNIRNRVGLTRYAIRAGVIQQ